MGEWRKTKTTGVQLHPRIEATVDVRVSTVDPEVDPNTGQLFFRSAEETTANLSRSGAFVRSWEPLGAGRRVLIGFELPGEGRLELMARVVWTQRELRGSPASQLAEPGFGVQFVDATRLELARLDRYLDRIGDPARRSAGQPAIAPAPLP